MPRENRIKSCSGIYHVVVRGINKQVIFEDEQDFNYFIKILEKCKEICKYELYAFCLMNNHIHLLIGEGDETISIIMKRLLLRYVIWYNRKYDRIGPLFQDRFYSDVIDDERRFIAAARYIFRNPVKAGMTNDVAKYRWSDYNAYWNDDELTSTDRLKKYFRNYSEFDEFMRTDSDDYGFEKNTISKNLISDDAAIQLSREILGDLPISSVSALNIEERNENIVRLIKAGINSKQLSRITGISRSIIQRIKSAH